MDERPSARITAIAVAALLLNAFTWGVSWWPFRTLQALGVHPLWTTSLMYLLATLALLAVAPGALRKGWHSRDWWVLLLASGLTNVCFNWAVAVGDVVRVVLLFYLMPAWVVVLAWPLLGERPNAGSLTRMALAMTGVGVVLKVEGQPWPWPQSLADGLALAGGFCFALTNIQLRRLRDTPTTASMLAMFVGGSALALLAALGGAVQGHIPVLPTLTWNWILGVLAMSGFFLVGNMGLQYGAARLPATTTSIVMLAEVVFASGSSVALGAGVVTAQVLAGAALILLASMLAARSGG